MQSFYCRIDEICFLKIGFVKWSNVTLVLNDKFSVRRRYDESDDMISSLVMCQDGKLLLADTRNDAIKYLTARCAPNDGTLENQEWIQGMDSDSRDGLDLNHGQLR